MQKPNRLPILAITLSLSCTAFGCSLQEIPAVGQQCPPDIPNAHASVQFGDIECYADMMESPSLDQNGECANDDFECDQNLKQCIRYQNDFQKLIDSNIGFISFISYGQNTTPYHPSWRVFQRLPSENAIVRMAVYRCQHEREDRIFWVYAVLANGMRP